MVRARHRVRGAGLAGRVAVAAAAWHAGMAVAAAEPRPGLPVAAFEEAVRESLAGHGDRMGYALTRCPLTPRFAPAGETYLGRAFSQRADTVIVLVAVEKGQVASWTEFDLPGLQGWITHAATRCRGATLTVGRGAAAQRYRWDGRGFVARR
ncbi:hypothetical protein M446_4384 [Methylobacterium sp. 4-46]|uniref:hypothetical protein n=1 Tax=unclassified Methylobacterium TaxID=2615210 RepID=UPI000152D73C|nr:MULTISPECIES: hypothetical protein [Methylobacterium]ACA18727.1 hypothetical protein M446_4384 [Methylobacterium sp. 4-46]WFT77957.1 hypothetical protein QA634_21985 [Methylobacterium nodulans]